MNNNSENLLSNKLRAIIRNNKKRSHSRGRALTQTLRLIALLAVSLFWSAPTFAAPPVQYFEPSPDLSVKVLGGSVVIQRAFIEGKWHPNVNWEPLKLSYDSLDGSVKSITRGKAEYKRLSPGVFRDVGYNTIRQTQTGFSWRNTSGSTIEFNPQGYILSYADRNGVGVRIASETPAGGTPRITGVFDHLNRQVLWFEYTGNNLTRIRDYTNREVIYRYNGANELNEVVDANGNSWTYAYTGGVPTGFTDPENRTITRNWANNGELSKIRYADNTGVDYIYDYDSAKGVYYKQEKTTGGRVTEQWLTLDQQLLRKDINGKTVETHVPESPGIRLRTQTDARGLTTTQNLDEWGNVIKTTYPDGSSTSATYDPQYANPLTRTDELGVITKYEYDQKGNLTRMTEALGLPEQRVTEYSYDQYGNRKTIKQLGDAVTQEALTQFDYDDRGNLTKVTDAENNVTEYPAQDYDVMGNSKRKIDARLKVWQRSYDNKGNLLSETDPLNHTNSTGYDRAGWVTSVTDAVGNVTRYGYDARKNLTSITDPYNAITRFEYNEDNLRTKEIDPGNKTILISEHNLDGLLNREIDGNNNVTQYVYGDESSGLNNLLIKAIYPTNSREFKYDNRNRIVETVDIQSAVISLIFKTSYDPQGREISSTDAENKTTTRTYDALGRFKSSTDPMNGVTEYTYDSRDNLIALKDQKNKTHRFSYDRLNRKLTEVRPLGQTLVYTYAPTSQLLTITDPKGQVKRFGYDDAGLKSSENHYLNAADLANNIPTRSIAFSFNDLGAPTGYSDSATAGTTSTGTVTYDTRQLQKAGETVNYGTFTLSHSYDYYANGLKKSYTGPDGVTINYTYDANNQLAAVQLPSGNITINSYKWMAPAQITLPGGTVRTNTYDPLMRLTQLQVKDPGQSEVMNYQYTHDNVGNIKTKNTEHGNYSYTYDDLYRLTQASNPSPIPSEGYTYDAVGNRITDTKTTGNWTYNENNELQGYTGISYEYDANGNTTKKTDASDPAQTRIYIYDTSNRLTEVRDQNNNLIATYTYDPFNRRIAKNVGGNTTFFFYSDEGLIAEADNAGSVTKTYGYKPDGTWTTDPLYLNEGGNTYYYQNDHLGTPNKLITSNGQIVWSAKSEAFGITTVDQASTVTNNLRFPGQYYDTETGQQYNWNRYYEATAGRYITWDLLYPDDSDEQYAYASANPIMLSDPTGEAIPAIYLRCVVVCAAVNAATTGCPGAGDCALSCINPLSWVKGPKRKGGKPPKPPGDCSAGKQKALQGLVNAACKPDPGGCSPGESCASMRGKEAAHTACADARKTINDLCFRGGNKGHQQEYTKRRQLAATCKGMFSTCR